MSSDQPDQISGEHGLDGEALRSWAPKTGTEARKSFIRWLDEGFVEAYLSGAHVLDVGYKGYEGDANPILPWAIGVDLDYPDYDGRRLPFEDSSQDTVFNSHVLEHIPDYRGAVADWFRVIRPGGYLVIIVPHQFLYERMSGLPSYWNGDHKRFYTAGSLLREIEESIDPMTFRVRHLEDNDRGFDYSLPPEDHAVGCYEIILVIQKIDRPLYGDRIFTRQLVARSDSIERIMTYTDSDYVHALYHLLLRRQPDLPGLEAYVGYLRNGFDRVEMLKIMADSEEAALHPRIEEVDAYLARSR